MKKEENSFDLGKIRKQVALVNLELILVKMREFLEMQIMIARFFCSLFKAMKNSFNKAEQKIVEPKGNLKKLSELKGIIKGKETEVRKKKRKTQGELLGEILYVGVHMQRIGEKEEINFKNIKKFFKGKMLKFLY